MSPPQIAAKSAANNASHQASKSAKRSRKELHPARLPPASRRPNVQRNAVQRSRSATWTLHPATCMVALLVVAHPSLACHHARKTHNYKQSPSTPRRVQARPVRLRDNTPKYIRLYSCSCVPTKHISIHHALLVNLNVYQSIHGTTRTMYISLRDISVSEEMNAWMDRYYSR